jgi:DMSO/TMAO reductase YedYZ molybdopterin-dependent catalytic subunit
MKKQLLAVMVLAIAFGVIGFSYLRGEFSTPATAIVPGGSEWRLVVNGSVYHPFSMTFNELVAMPTTTVGAELDCYGTFVDSGNWTGVRLGLILAKVQPYLPLGNVTFHATDGYSSTLTFATAMRKDVIIAYEKDGKSLPETTRLVVPQANGDEWINSICQIEIVIP